MICLHHEGLTLRPGRHTADASLWSGIATMLATLDFNATKDANGNDIDFEPEFSNGLTQSVQRLHTMFSIADYKSLILVTQFLSLVTLSLVHILLGRSSNVLLLNDGGDLPSCTPMDNELWSTAR